MAWPRSYETIEAGQATALRHARGASPAHAGPHRGDALVPGRRARRAGGAPAEGPVRQVARAQPQRPAASRGAGGGVHRRHALQGLRRRRQSARAHHLHGPARLDHGHADGAAAGHGHLPGPRRRDHGRAASGTTTPSSASGAASTRRAPSVHGARRARHAGAARAPTTTAARRPGCAGRTAPTTSFPGRKSSVAAA